jgi:glycosyltransferase involved in cell wall biosynthesis
MKKLAIITTHPIQYNAPMFKLLSERRKINIKVFYTWEQSKEKVFDEKFGKVIIWDIPLLSGYDYTFTKNISKNPSSGHFQGVINPTLIEEIEKWQAEAILVFGWNHNSHFKVMRYFKRKIPVYFRGDSTIIDNLTLFRKFARNIALSIIYKFIDYAFYVGKNNKSYYLKYGLTEKQLIFAPHAIDNNRFSEKNKIYEKKAEEIRNKLNLSKNDIVFLFAGKFEAIKNPLLIIEVAARFPQYKFLFVGNGHLEQKLKQKAGKNVVFLPFQNQLQMPVIYNICDVFVLPSQGKGETWGLAVNEAMACGKPVLVSDKVGCAVDLVKNGQNGYIFKSNNIDDLIEKINLFENKYLEFGKESKKIIKNWSFEKIALVIENKLINK